MRTIMGLAYLFALVVSVGILLVQAFMGGGKDGDLHHGDDISAHSDFDLVALLGSLRFWVFALLAFGLSGGLLHALALAGSLLTFLLAASSGLLSGTFAVLVFRAVRRASLGTQADALDATGQIGRMLVDCAPGKLGQVRVELKGHSVDLLATTSDERGINRGEAVLVEDVQGDVAYVCRRPGELE